MKQYFYSYYTYKDGLKSSFGHGSIEVDNESRDAYNEIIMEIESKLDDRSIVIHLIAFNLIN